MESVKHGRRITQVKPRDDLFWFNKPEILLWLIQFVIFQNAFEMATYIWSLWGLKERSCFMRNQYMIIIRLASGVIVQFWCSYMTVPLNVIVSQNSAGICPLGFVELCDSVLEIEAIGTLITLPGSFPP
ncbi:hypothetical protein K1719_005248 [Acacia pycnantha]|nr:hypothetical protein K1719_005248 [Acacia pycnantha]